MTPAPKPGSSPHPLSVVQACELAMKRTSLKSLQVTRGHALLVTATYTLQLDLSDTVLMDALCDEWMADVDPGDEHPKRRWLTAALALLGAALELQDGQLSPSGQEALEFALAENFAGTTGSELRDLMADPADYGLPLLQFFQALMTNVLCLPAVGEDELRVETLQDPRYLYVHRLLVAIVTMLKWEQDTSEHDVLEAYRTGR